MLQFYRKVIIKGLLNKMCVILLLFTNLLFIRPTCYNNYIQTCKLPCFLYLSIVTQRYL